MRIKEVFLIIVMVLCVTTTYGQNSTQFNRIEQPQKSIDKQDNAEDDDGNFPIGSILSIIGSLGAVSAIAYGCMQHIHDISQTKRKEQEEYLSSFNILVSNLSTGNKTSQISAAILLRRYLRETKNFTNLENETINVISSMSRTFPTGILQKTLVDGLASVSDLSRQDLSKTNLQDAYLGVKEGKIVMYKTDLFLADLSYALIQNIVGHEIIFYRSVLLGAQIKDCDFTNANFVGADLTNAVFKNVILDGANFSGAYNIPPDIESKLKNGIYPDNTPVTAKHISTSKSIFFSMPGKVEEDREMLIKEYKRILEGKGYNVIYYNRDIYPSYGQFNRVREGINRSIGMIAFGLRQIHIHNATYRPNTEEIEEWKDKWLSTPWSDIEVGMGLMKGLPILLVTDSEITDGVFDLQLSECYVANIPTNYDCKKIEQNPQFDEWLSKL